MSGRFASCPDRLIICSIHYLCRMKLLPLLFSLYILLLSCIPCSDNNVCSDSTAAFDISAPTHDDHDHHNDLCSPFCVCICCGMSIVPGYTFTASAAEIHTHQTTSPTYASHFISEVYVNIWQPPKIG